jgi:choline kinase
MDASKYPNNAQRRDFYRAYLSCYYKRTPLAAELDTLENQVRVWSAASHAMWTVWGLVQAREEVAGGEVPEFPYVKYAFGRMNAFFRELDTLSITNQE